MNSTAHPKRFVIATHNKAKAAEIRKILGDSAWELLSLDDFDKVPEASETEDSYEGNAVAKARHYALATGEWVIADDSGLEVASLDRAPGVLSARYAGSKASDADRRLKLLKELASTPSANRDAQFVCSVALATPFGEIVKVTKGVCEGFICKAARGSSGFGYDPVFVPKGFSQTFAELPQDVKNQISHRAKALHSLLVFLRSLK